MAQHFYLFGEEGCTTSKALSSFRFMEREGVAAALAVVESTCEALSRTATNFNCLSLTIILILVA